MRFLLRGRISLSRFIPGYPKVANRIIRRKHPETFIDWAELSRFLGGTVEATPGTLHHLSVLLKIPFPAPFWDSVVSSDGL